MTETIIAIVFGLLSFAGLVVAIRSFLRKEKAAAASAPSPEFAPVVSDVESERCVCGEIATEPAPYIEREREDDSAASNYLMRHHDRNVYAAPPRLRRTVDKAKPPAFCRVHAHVADAKIDEFLYVKVRAVLAEANSRIAVEAASFEKEALIEAVKNSLTRTEKSKPKASSNGALNGATSSMANPVSNGAPPVLS